MTQYGSSERRWCGFDRTNPVLPDFVRAGMTVAVAEPYNGSSYKGDPGEACGECWELSTSFSAQIVMVHDLCPIEGNPVCAGSFFHFDVSTEVANAIDGDDQLGLAAVRRVPCPVNGNIYAYVGDRNQYGYLKLAFFNHRLPIRKVEYQAVGSDTWLPMQRCLARWCVDGDMTTFAEGGPGALLRLTSATGQTTASGAILSYAARAGTDFDIGAQFAEQPAPTDLCSFMPPGDVYDDAWGEAGGVGWSYNTWGNTSLAEISEGCAEASQSCVRMREFAGSGVHITYRHAFPTAAFARLSLQMRTESGSGTVEVAPRTEDARCENPTTVAVDPGWTAVDIEIAASCPGANRIQGLTISRPSGAMDLVVDQIHFE